MRAKYSGTQTPMQENPEPKKTGEKKPMIAFPIESIFPGIHAEKPEVAEHEAWMFMKYGAKSETGIDLSNPATRRAIFESSEKDFQDNIIHPLPPEITDALSKIPDDWMDHKESCDALEEINVAIEKYYDVPPHLYVSINEWKEAWIQWKP